MNLFTKNQVFGIISAIIYLEVIMEKSSIGNNIYKILKDQGRSVKWLHEKSGIPATTIYSYLGSGKDGSNVLNEKLIYSCALCLDQPISAFLKGVDVGQLKTNRLIESFNAMSTRFSVEQKPKTYKGQTYWNFIITDHSKKSGETGVTSSLSLDQFLEIRAYVFAYGNRKIEELIYVHHPLDWEDEIFSKGF